MNFLLGCVAVFIAFMFVVAYPPVLLPMVLVVIVVWLVNAAKKASDTTQSSNPQSRAPHAQAPSQSPSSYAVQQQGRTTQTVHPSLTQRSGSTQPQTLAPMNWVGEGQSITIGNYTIRDPLTYIYSGPPCLLDASCIRTNSSIGVPAPEPKGMLGYWPDYTRLTPKQRANYLVWMAGGRKAPLDDIGYAFIFFYGLERRVLIDKSDVMPALREVLRLLSTYRHSGSFNGYLSCFVAYVVARSSLQKVDQGSYNYILHDTMERWNNELAAIALAWLYEHQVPLPPESAYRLAMFHPSFPRSVVINRLPKEFKTLFSRKYAERFGQGIVLKCAKRPFKLAYYPASASLHQYHGTSTLPTMEVPDVMGISSQFKALLDLWASCIEELAPLSRKVAKGVDVHTREAYEALPPALKAEVDHPDKPKWERLFAENSREGMALIPVSAIAGIHGVEERNKLSAKQSDDLVRTACDIGLFIVPDATYRGRPYAWNEAVALVRSPDRHVVPPSDAYRSASVLLEVGVAIAGVDGAIHQDEVAHITQFLDNQFMLDPADSLRLQAYLQVLTQQPPALADISKRLQSVLSVEQRETLGQFIVGVAAAEGVIDEKEIAALRSAYRVMEIAPEKLDALLDSIQVSSSQPVEVRRGRRSSRAGEALPTRPVPGQPITIDSEQVRRILAETADVARMLGEAMQVEDEEPITSAHPPEPDAAAAQRSQAASQTSLAVLQSLDQRYHGVVTELLTRQEWSRPEFEELARRHGLMPAGMFDAINEWADEYLGDFLIEDGDTYTVHTDLTEGRQ